MNYIMKWIMNEYWHSQIPWFVNTIQHKGLKNKNQIEIKF
jgi:hypothetical protein